MKFQVGDSFIRVRVELFQRINKAANAQGLMACNLTIEGDEDSRVISFTLTSASQ
jgi:hypothetical protein